MSDLSSIIQSLQELQRMHQLNFELLEEFGVLLDYIKTNNFPIPNEEKFNILLSKVSALLRELYFTSPQILTYRKLSDESLQASSSDKDLTEPQNRLCQVFGGFIFCKFSSDRFISVLTIHFFHEAQK